MPFETARAWTRFEAEAGDYLVVWAQSQLRFDRAQLCELEDVLRRRELRLELDEQGIKVERARPVVSRVKRRRASRAVSAAASAPF